jgi:hypothetical protein
MSHDCHLAIPERGWSPIGVRGRGRRVAGGGAVRGLVKELVSVGLRERRRPMRHNCSLGWIAAILTSGMVLFGSIGVVQAATLYQYYNTGDDAALFSYGIYWKAQTFTPSTAHTITSVKLKLYRVGSPGTVTVSIRATDGSGHPTGPDLCSGTTDGNTLTTATAGEWREITLGAGYNLNAATKYAVTFRAPSGNSSNYIAARDDATSPTYAGGNDESSSNSGSSWSSGANDYMFEEWGQATIAERGNATNTGSSGTAISITRPTVNSGDVVVAFMLANSTGDTITDNNGSYAFTQAIQEEAAGGGVSMRYAIFYRVAGASEPSTYTWNLASSTNWGIVIRVFSGVDTASVWDVAPSTSTEQYSSSSQTTATAPSMTTVTPGAMGIVAFFTDGNYTYSNVTNGYGTLVEEHAQRAVATAVRTWATAGATGTTSATLSSSDDWTAHQIALKPATGGSPPAAPVATAATNVQATSFSANWNSSSGATGYYLDVATDSGFTSFVSGYQNLDVGNVLTYSVDTNISAGTDYYYRVRAYNGSGTSSSSNTVAVTTVATGGGIVVDNYQLAGDIINTDTGTLSSFAVGSGSNRLLVVFVHESGVNSLGVQTVSSVTFGGVNLSHYSNTDVSEGTESRTEVWYLVNPSVSTADIVVTLSAATDAIMIGAVSLNGVDQSTPIASSQIYQVQSSQTSVPITWTTLYDNSLLLGSWTNRYSLSGSVTVSADSPETSVWDFVSSTSWHGRADGAYKTADAGSNTLSWTVSPGIYLGATGAGIEIKTAPIDIYYSVGTSTADLKSGSPTITISSGTATFSTAQPDNVGVGDKITYNTSSIAYITGRTSSTVYTVETATGGTPANVSGQTVNSIKRTFNSLSSANSNSHAASYLNTYDLVTNNYVLHWPCYKDGVMDDSPSLSGSYTTNATHYIDIYTPKSTSEVGTSQRHTGIAGTGFVLKPVVSSPPGGGYYVIVVNPDVHITGIEIDGSSVTNQQGIFAIYVNSAPTGAVNVFEDLIIHDITNSSGTSTVAGIRTDYAQTYISNSIIYNITNNTTSASATYGIDYNAYGGSGTNYVYNNTLYKISNTNAGNTGNAYGIYRSNGTVTAKNNAVLNVTSAGGSGYCYNGISTQAYNVSSDATASGTGSQTNKTSYSSYFVSTTSGSENLHLTGDSYSLWGSYGTNLSGDPNLPVTDDIDGDARDSSNPDIGADEYQASPANLDQIHYRWRNDDGGETGSGTVNIGAVQTVAGSGTSVTQFDIANVAISGSNRYLLVGIWFNDDDYQTISSVVLDPGGGSQTSLALLDSVYASVQDDGRCALFGVVNPPTGTFTVRVTISAHLTNSEDGLIAGAWPLSGVDQSNPIGPVATADEATSGNASVTVESAAGDTVFGVSGIEDQTNMTGSDTEDWNLQPSNDKGVGEHKSATSSSTTLNWTNASDKWCAIGVSVKPASGSGATWAANEDTKLTGLTKGTIRRVRFEVSNEGGSTSGGVTYQLEVAQTDTCGSGSYTAVPTGTGGDWQIVNSTYITNGEATSNIVGGLTDESATFIPGQLEDASNTTGSITLNGNEFTEIEFAVQATTSATDGANYCFRLTNSGAALNTYDKYAEVTLAGGTAPPAPVATAATDIQATSFSANWEASSGATGYYLDVATDSSFGAGTFVSGYQDLDVGNVLTYSVDTNISENTDYYYRVRAYNAYGTSGDSNTINLTTLACGTPLTVAVDTVTTGQGTGSTITVSHTTSGTNRLMLVGISGRASTGSYAVVSGATYDGAALTLVGTQQGPNYVQTWIYGLVDPAPGTHDLVVNFSTAPSNGGVVGVMTFTGVDQNTPLGSFASASGPSGTASVDVPSSPGELVFDSINYGEGSATVGAGQTEQWNLAPSYIGGAGSTEPGGGSTLYEYYNTHDDAYDAYYGANWGAQTFTPSTAHKITSVKLKLYRAGSPGTLTVGIRATDGSGQPTGPDLCSGTMDGSTLTTSSSGAWYEISLGAGYDLSASTQYAIVIRAPAGNSSNYVRWRGDETSPTYSGGHYWDSSASGSSWEDYGSVDAMFEEWGEGTSVTMSWSVSYSWALGAVPIKPGVAACLPAAPLATAATDVEATSFSANWNASSGATGYYLDVATNDTFTSYVTGYNNLDVGNVLTYSVSSNISPNTAYYYRLRAYNTYGTSGNSNTIGLSTLCLATIAETGNAGNGGSSATASVTHGLTINAGDVVIAIVHANYSGGSISDNNGAYPFTQAIQEDNPGQSSRYAIYYRVAGSSEPSTFSWTLSSSAEWSVLLRVFSGVNTTSVWDVAPSTSTRAYAGSGSIATAPSMTTSTDGAMGIVVFVSDSTVSWSAPTNGYGTGVQDATRSVGSFVRLWATAGSTGTAGATLSASNDWLAHQIALKPAAAPCPPAAPVATAATNVQTTSFSANWNASSGATGYYLDVATNDTFTSYVTGYNNLDVGNVLTYSVDTNISANTTYYYRVRAYNAYGTSGNSNTISVTTTGTGCGAAIAFDAASEGHDTSSSEVTGLTISHTVGGGINRILVVGVNMMDTTSPYPTVSSMTYAGQPMTFLAGVTDTADARIRSEMWYITAPATGTNDIVITFTDTVRGVVAGGMSYTGVDQTTPFGTPSSAEGKDTAPSVVVSSAAREVVVDTVGIRQDTGGTQTLTAGAGQTDRYNDASAYGTLPNNNNVVGAGSEKAGSASVTMSWTASSSGDWAIVAAPLKPAQPPCPSPFSYRRPITITDAMTPASCGATISDFPVLVSISNDANLKTTANGGHVENPDGYDIIFRAEDSAICTDSGNPAPCTLDHEVEKYDGSTGTLVAWVRIPTLHTSGDTIYMYYDNPAITTPTANRTGVWNSGYKGVWHLGDAGGSGGTLDVSVNASADDAMEDLSSGSMDTTNNLVVQGDTYAGGYRFANVTIPHGAAITNATITLYRNWASGTTDLYVYGEAADDAAVFTTTTHDISNRTRTTANVLWAGLPTGGTAPLTSPDISSVIQEVVDGSGWSSGNHLAVLMWGANGQRFEATSYTATWGGPAALHIEYTSKVKDSTANANDGVPTGAPTFGATGAMDGAISFGGANDFVDLSNLPSLTNATWSVWTYPLVDNDMVCWIGKWQSGDNGWFFGSRGDDKVTLETPNSTFYTSASAYSANHWHHLVATADGSNVRIYIDGNLDVTLPQSAAIDNSGTDSFIGTLPSFQGTWYANAVLDEVRISNVARDACWVGSEYNNESAPGTYVTVGAEQAAPTAIELIDLRAVAQSDGRVLVSWHTGFEVDNLGFHVYREVNGERVRVTPGLVAGSALFAGGAPLTAGRSYSWLDRSPVAGAVYWLEEWDLSGERRWHGPVTVEAGPVGVQVQALSVPASSGSTQTSSRLLAGVGQSSSPSLPQGVRRKLRRAVGSGEDRLAVQWGLASGPAVKILVSGEGWYRVSQDELVTAGLDPGVDPSRLQLFTDGQEVPILVDAQQQGRFASGDAIEFYGLGMDTPSTGVRVYWLVAGTGAGARVQVEGGGGSWTPGPSSFPCEVERADRTLYVSAVLNGEASNFFGAVVTATPVDQAVRVLHVDQGSPGELTVRLQGGTEGSHQVGVELNGVRVGTVAWEGMEVGELVVPVGPGMILEGANVVTLAAEGGDGDVSAVESIRVRYQHTWQADGDALEFTVGGYQEVTIGGFKSAQVRVVDITDPWAVEALPAEVEKQGASYQVRVGVPEAGERTLMAVGTAGASHPVGVVPNRPSAWHAPSEGADLVMIGYRSLLPSMEPLRALRETQGLKVAVVDVESVYNEFSYGNKDPKAIRDFMGWARQHWVPAPRYLLLVGDASFDPRNYLGYGWADLVPSKPVDTKYMETDSDDWLTDFNGDGIGDIPVGRLPVQTASEAAAVVAKLVAYDSGPRFGRVLLLADANDSENDFEGMSERIKAVVPSSVWVSEILRGQVGDAAAQSELTSQLNLGQTLVSYVGHGTVDAWHGGVLTAAQAAALRNYYFPFVVTMTCLNGYFSDPQQQSLAGALLDGPGGAVAVWASSGLTESTAQIPMGEALMRLLFSGTTTLGDATRAAKAATDDMDVRRTWMLFGDPTTRMR